MATRNSIGIFDGVWAQSGERTEFGAFGTGWDVDYSNKASGKKPERRVFNDNFAKTTAVCVDVNLNGATLPWDAAITYNDDARVTGSDGNLYKALSPQAGNDPVSSPTFWDDQNFVDTATQEKIDSALQSDGSVVWANTQDCDGHGLDAIGSLNFSTSVDGNARMFQGSTNPFPGGWVNLTSKESNYVSIRMDSTGHPAMPNDDYDLITKLQGDNLYGSGVSPNAIEEIGTAMVGGDKTGDTRGAGALDVQSSRLNSTEIASGSDSVCYGIESTASAAGTISVGRSCSSTNTDDFSLGISCDATGTNSIAIGNGCSSSADGAISIGRNIENSNSSSLQLGPSNVNKMSIFGNGIFAHPDSVAIPSLTELPNSGEYAFRYNSVTNNLEIYANDGGTTIVSGTIALS